MQKFCLRPGPGLRPEAWACFQPLVRHCLHLSSFLQVCQGFSSPFASFTKKNFHQPSFQHSHIPPLLCIANFIHSSFTFSLHTALEELQDRTPSKQTRPIGFNSKPFPCFHCLYWAIKSNKKFHVNDLVNHGSVWPYFVTHRSSVFILILWLIHCHGYD